MKKKVLSLVLASAMVISMAACGNSNTSTSDSSSASTSTEASTSTPTTSDEVETVATVASQIEGMSYEESSAYLYNLNMSEFYDLYVGAKEILTDNDQRFAQMAVAEAKLMAAATLLPTQSGGGNYAMTRIAPYTISSVLWGNDPDRFHNAVVTTELIKATDIATMRAQWNELRGTGEYEQWAKDYLVEQGYELTDVFNNQDYSTDPQNWDILATSRAVDNQVIVNTVDGLMEYDNENVQQPALAESYEISADGLTYTFHLREGVNWVDSQGRTVAPLVADDFVAAMQHMLDARAGLEFLVDGVILNATEYMTGEVTDFAQVGVKALDDYTVEYTLTQETPYFLTMLGYSIFLPMSRSYYESQGGKFGMEYDPSAADYTYGRGPESIVYCGPYLVTNWTAQNSIVFRANESYWNADNINIHELNWVWEDGTDTLKIYNDLIANVISGAGLNASAIEVAKNDGIFDEYAYISRTNATSYCGFFNLHRQAFANFNDETAAVSEKSEEDIARSLEASNNVHFRRAVYTSIDRASYLEASVGTELRNVRLRNSYTPGNFVSLENETTVDINGTATTFPAGTAYAEIMQAQLDADGVEIKVWDSATASGDGFDGWYNPEYAASELQVAIEELAAAGVVVDASNPIYLDWPYNASSEIVVNRVNAVKQSVENALGGCVVLNLVSCPDSNTVNNTQYFAEFGYDCNYDFSDGSGWSPDYGDPSSYLDTIIPGGYMVKTFGIY